MVLCITFLPTLLSLLKRNKEYLILFCCSYCCQILIMKKQKKLECFMCTMRTSLPIVSILQQKKSTNVPFDTLCSKCKTIRAQMKFCYSCGFNCESTDGEPTCTFVERGDGPHEKQEWCYDCFENDLTFLKAISHNIKKYQQKLKKLLLKFNEEKAMSIMEDIHEEACGSELAERCAICSSKLTPSFYIQRKTDKICRWCFSNDLKMIVYLFPKIVHQYIHLNTIVLQKEEPPPPPPQKKRKITVTHSTAEFIETKTVSFDIPLSTLQQKKEDSDDEDDEDLLLFDNFLIDLTEGLFAFDE